MLTVAFMAIPNLFGLLILHREVKQTIGDYWSDFKREHPEEKIPKMNNLHSCMMHCLPTEILQPA